MAGAALKWSDRKIRFVHVWTLGAKSATRDYIALGGIGGAGRFIAARRCFFSSSMCLCLSQRLRKTRC